MAEPRAAGNTQGKFGMRCTASRTAKAEPPTDAPVRRSLVDQGDAASSEVHRVPSQLEGLHATETAQQKEPDRGEGGGLSRPDAARNAKPNAVISASTVADRSRLRRAGARLAPDWP